MGFLKKLVKGIGKGIGKVFKGIAKGVKKLFKSKLGKALLIGGALLAGGWAAGFIGNVGAGAAATASTAGVSGLSGIGASTPGLAASLGKGGSIIAAGATDAALGTAASTATGVALGKGGQMIAAGLPDIAAGTATSTAGTGLSAGNLLSSAWEGAKSIGSKAAGFIEANPTTSLIGGSMLSGAMRSKAEQDMLEDERKYQRKMRDQETAFGVTYGGQDHGVSGSQQLQQINQQYAGNRNILGGEATAPAAPGNRQKLRFNPQTKQWEAA